MTKSTNKLWGWTDAEDDLIRKHYPGGGVDSCRVYLKHRTEHSIKQRAHLLGVRMQPLKSFNGQDPDEALAPDPLEWTHDAEETARREFVEADERLREAEQTRARAWLRYAILKQKSGKHDGRARRVA